ncbi:AI-2E family transporter [Clostridium chromiireducens]|uniref:Pheromone autoinducer 2 transporter n=1 Tax=Clostridium chromiireducens TaxID=225345 RepID=A0A1V4IPC4_9CLOT|nr:AI-2E family transporter [Clostridium chromiireducens]OPJ61858.1 pheromone autoinducer 2 transporter [Clostridium chromiireducens]
MYVKKHKNQIILILTLVCFFAIILSYLYSDPIRTTINIIILSFILAYTLSPIRDLFETRLKVSRKSSSILVILIIIGIVATCVIVIVPTLFNEIANISNVFENVSDFLKEAFGKFSLNNNITTNVLYNEVLEEANSIWINFSENAVDRLMSLGNNLLSLSIIPIMVYYFLCDGNKIYNKILLLLPTQKRGLTKKILSDIDRVLTKYISSQLLLSGLIGALTFVILLMLKVKFPLWISILNAILNIIPYFGPIFGAIPAIIVALLDSPIKALWVTLGMFIIQQLEGDILSPKMTGDSTNMHPFMIIILLLIGDKFGGFIGMVLVVPIAVTIKVLYDDINYYLF